MGTTSREATPVPLLLAALAAGETKGSKQREAVTMSEDNDRPATRDDVIYAVAVIIMALMLCSATDTCSRRLQINKLREDLQQR